ncbi:hypothetical protein BDZ97DRAFT_1801370, partial [Flammula alnicola]
MHTHGGQHNKRSPRWATNMHTHGGQHNKRSPRWATNMHTHGGQHNIPRWATKRAYPRWA